MGFSVSWLATRDLSPEQLEARLGSSFLAVSEDSIGEVGNVATKLPNGFALLFCHEDAELCESLAQQLSGQGGEFLAASVEEHVMFSRLTLWRGGERVWSVVHDGSEGGDELEVVGESPPELADVVARCEEERSAEDAHDDVDYVFDVPIDLGRALVGFRHDHPIGPAAADALDESCPDPANRGKRLLAKLIDVFVVALTALGFASMTDSLLVGLLVGYGWLLISDGDSASPGKWVFKLQSFSATTGRPATFAQSALRNAPLVIVEADSFHRAWLGVDRDLYREQFPVVFTLGLVFSTLWYAAALVMMYRDPLQRRPGDRFAGTVVRSRSAGTPR